MSKICVCSPSIILGSLDSIIVIMQALFSKAKDVLNNDTVTESTASTSADTDRLNELLRAACNVIYIINTNLSIDTSGSSSATGSSVGSSSSSNNYKTEFIDKVVKTKPLLVSILDSIAQEKKVYE